MLVLLSDFKDLSGSFGLQGYKHTNKNLKAEFPMADFIIMRTEKKTVCCEILASVT